MSNFDAHQALEFINGTLVNELPLKRVGEGSKSKAQVYEMGASGKQFALMLGDKDKSTNRFTQKEVKIVLEEQLAQEFPDVKILPDSATLKSSALARTQLKPPRQKSVLVTSPTGLRSVLQWYADAKVSPIPAAPEKVKDMNQKTPSTTNSPVDATNTILYGPPGTGKTYATAGRAVMLCDGAVPGDGSRQAILARYEELRIQGRIHFVTFHQSYGYEEFVEGLRPIQGPSGQVTYEVQPGAFRRACESANLRQHVSPGLTGKPLSDRLFYKMSLGQSWSEQGVEVFRYCVQNDCVLLGWGEDVDFSGCNDKTAIRDKLNTDAPSIEKMATQVQFANRFKHELRTGDIIIVSNGNRSFRGVAEVIGEYEFVEDAPFHQSRPVRWLAVFEAGRPSSDINPKDFTMTSLHRLGGINHDALERILSEEKGDDETPKPHVLIIDEINRANISKVFGELITLLEPDKRHGAENPITLKLAYSGKDFSVPNNLHLLGTMNTADRSIAVLDTALRRRFDFEELMPDPSELKKVNIEEADIDLELLLKALNERVEALYDREHTVGHAFFMGVKNLNDLERVFRRKVLPLLQEYFYERGSDVRRVLNDLEEGDFIQRRALPQVAADGDDAYADEPRVAYSVNPTPFPPRAYQRIYNAC